MTQEIQNRIEQIRQGDVPEGYKRTKVGVIPVEWDEIRLGSAFSERNERNMPDAQLLSITGNKGVVCRSELEGKDNSSEDKSGYKRICAGDIGYNTMRMWQGVSALSSMDGIVSPAYTVLVPQHNVSAKCYSYVFKLQNMINVFYRHSQGLVDDTRSLKYEWFKTIRAPFPPLAEQERIAEILETQDRVIALCEKKVEELKKLKKVFLQKMFLKPGNTVPELRFPGFTGEWEQRKLAEVLAVTTRKNGNTYTKDDVLSVSDEYGCVNQIRFQGRSFAGEDISNYKIVHTGDIVYTRSPLQAKPYGIIKRVGAETGIVSPLYIVNETADGYDSKFVYYTFDSPQKTNNYLSPLVRKGAKNTMNISNDEWLSGEIMVATSIEEQQHIGVFLETIDNLITLRQRKCDEEKHKKKALMQLLLTGIVRVKNE